MEKLKEFIKNNNLYLPNYKNEINIIDLMRCLYMKCGYNIETTNKIKELNSIIPDNKHYLFILSDGTGSNLISKLDNNSILKRNLRDNIVTVFPSTTGCVLTSIVTAKFPETHGIWGWFNYNRSLNRDYFPLLFSDRKTMKSLNEFNIKSEDVYKSESILKKMDIKTNILFPDYICDSVYSKFVGDDNNRYSYNNFSDIKKIIFDICNNNESSYTYLYLSDIDTLEHENGVNSDIVLEKLIEIDDLIKSLVKIKDMTIVFTADHGQTNISEDIIFPFSKYEKYFYAYPSIDFGTASYYVKTEFEKEFVKEFEKEFKDKMFLFKTKEFIDNRLFGEGNMNKYSFENLGEYISLCKTGTYLINSPDISSYLGKIKGNHSGLTEDEMIIPLIVINTNE